MPVKNDRVKVRLPIKKPMLKILIQETANLFHDQPFLLALYQAILITMYYGLFRICEVTKTVSGHEIKVKDVKIGNNKNKLLFILRTSKMHGHGSKPFSIKINSTDFDPMGNLTSQAEFTDEYCPFKLLRNYLQLRKKRRNNEEQFFVFYDRTPVTAVQFRSILRSLLSRVGFDYTFYGSHSICTGRTGDLLDQGIEWGVLCKLGRRKMNGAIYTYLKP